MRAGSVVEQLATDEQGRLKLTLTLPAVGGFENLSPPS